MFPEIWELFKFQKAKCFQTLFCTSIVLGEKKKSLNTSYDKYTNNPKLTEEKLRFKASVKAWTASGMAVCSCWIN